MASPLEPEFGIWYGVCWVVLLARFASRRLHRGAWRALQIDDYLIVLAMATDSALTVVMHIVVKSRSNLIAPGEDVSRFTPPDIKQRVYGSKLVLVVEQLQIVTIWLVKTCLLILYYRATSLLKQRKLVYIAAVYVAIGFIVMEVLYFAVWCRPFSQYWAVPPNSSQCSVATNHLIVNTVFNISSDLLILYIPIPLLRKIMIPLRSKIILGGLFLIGVASIISAALNKYYSFTHPYGTEWTIWYLRESYTALLCANLLHTYPLIQRIWKMHRSFFGDSIRINPSRRLPSLHPNGDLRIHRTTTITVEHKTAEGQLTPIRNVSPLTSVTELEHIVGSKGLSPVRPIEEVYHAS